MVKSELWRLTLREAGDGLASRAFSAVELLDVTLARLRETEPAVNAYVTLMEGSARSQASLADHELGRGRSRGPLHGIPVGVKDVCYTEGVSTQAGSRVLADFVPDCDATVVRRLKDAGAVVIGKTVTHEFAYGLNVPPTRNPWQLDCYPGGSSAGSAVSVAVGSSFGAIGTDTGGSIRVPASVNGIVGLKPTNGRVSRFGVIPMSPTLDTVGPLTRTAEDCALMLGAIAGYDQLDAGSIDEPVKDYVSRLDQGINGLRFGLDREYFLSKRVSSEVSAAVETAIAELEAIGAQMVEVRLPDLEFAALAGMSILLADTSERHRHWLRSQSEKYVSATRVMLELGELVLATQYVHAQRARAALRDRIHNAFSLNRLDCLIGPTLPITTIPLDEFSVDLMSDKESALSSFRHYCFLGNVLGLPALSVPCGFNANQLPIGLQFYGRPFEEDLLLRIGHSYQQVTSWHSHRPEPR